MEQESVESSEEGVDSAWVVGEGADEESKSAGPDTIEWVPAALRGGDAPAGTPADSSESSGGSGETPESPDADGPDDGESAPPLDAAPLIDALEGELTARCEEIERRLDGLAALAPRVEQAEALAPRVEQIEALAPRVDELEGLRPRVEAVEAMERRLDSVEELKPRLDEADEELSSLAERVGAQGERFDAVDEALAGRIGRDEAELKNLAALLRDGLAEEAAARKEALTAVSRRISKASEAARSRERELAAERKLLGERTSGLDDRVARLGDRLGETIDAERAARSKDLQRLGEELKAAVTDEGEDRRRLADELTDRIGELATGLERLAAAEVERGSSLSERLDGAERINEQVAERINSHSEALERLAQELAENLAPQIEATQARSEEMFEIVARVDEHLAQARERAAVEQNEREWLEQRLDGRLLSTEQGLEVLGRKLEQIAAGNSDAARTAQERQPAPAERPPLKPSSDDLAQLEGADLNDLRFEELRTLGLSTTQAARLLAARERLGGFSGLDQLDAVPGIPAQTRDELKRRVTLSR